jgi:adenylate kinase family enzyme
MSIGQRIIVVGTSGSGKSTMAKSIAINRQIPRIELDSLFWKSNWEETPDEEFIGKIRAALCEVGDSWVLDGNYSRTQHITWPLADTIVWLDYPRRLSFSRLVKRTLTRVFTREELWSGNRESVKNVFFSKDSLLLYALKTYNLRKTRYTKLMLSDKHPHLTFIRLCHPREAAWLINQL